MSAENPDELNELARRHLWLHFARLGNYDDTHPIPVIARGDGCSVWDAAGKQYLDGLSGLFTVQVGHGRADLAQAAQSEADAARRQQELRM